MIKYGQSAKCPNCDGEFFVTNEIFSSDSSPIDGHGYTIIVPGRKFKCLDCGVVTSPQELFVKADSDTKAA